MPYPMTRWAIDASLALVGFEHMADLSHFLERGGQPLVTFHQPASGSRPIVFLEKPTEPKGGC